MIHQWHVGSLWLEWADATLSYFTWWNDDLGFGFSLGPFAMWWQKG